MPRFMLTIWQLAGCLQCYEMLRTSRVHGHPDVLDDTVLSKYFSYMVLFDIPGEGFDDNLSQH